MPAKNIITNQPVTKAKLERAKELRREMTPDTPSALSGTSPKSDIETLDNYQDFILSDLGEDGWG